MVKRLTKHGNSLAVVLDKPILDLLNITDQTALDISTDGQSLVISPIRDEKEEAKFRKALKNVHQRYGDVLKKLAQ